VLILWVNWPRSGSTWASWLLAHSTGLLWNPGIVGAEENAVHRVHWQASEWNIRQERHGLTCKIVLEIRDPRDTVVSYYYHVLRERPELTTDNFRLLDYIQAKFLRFPRPILNFSSAEPACSWPDYYRAWRENGYDLEVRHEDVLADPVTEITRLAEGLGLPIINDIERLLEKYPIHMRAPYTREYVEGQPLERTVPCGISRWYERLSGEGERLIRKHCADIMKQYRYE